MRLLTKVCVTFAALTSDQTSCEANLASAYNSADSAWAWMSKVSTIGLWFLLHATAQSVGSDTILSFRHETLMLNNTSHNVVNHNHGRW